WWRSLLHRFALRARAARWRPARYAWSCAARSGSSSPSAQERRHRGRTKQRRREGGHSVGAQHSRLGQVWTLRQIVHLWPLHQQEERIERADRGALIYPVEIRIADAALMQLRHAVTRARAQILQLTELDGLRGAGLRTGGRHTSFLPVVAERTLPRA